MRNQHLATPEGASGPAADYLHKLPATPNFYASGNLDYYRPLPTDWWIAATDVSNSTQIIESGRYREVNMLGAATIIGLLNVVAPDALPFVFGGDGAMVCLPSPYKERAQALLDQLQQMARTALDIELRTNLIPYTALSNEPPFWVGKYNLSPDATQYSFLGHGVQQVDQLLKDQHSDTSLERPEPDPGVDADFSGLECRWKPVKSPTGETLTVLVEPFGSLDQQLSTLNDLLSLYRSTIDRGGQSKPLRRSRLSMSWNPLMLFKENAVVSSLQNSGDRWSRWLDAQWRTMVGSFLMNKQVQTEETDWGRYKDDLIAHSDYRKIDGLLRFVASVTPPQKKDWIHQLQELQKQRVLRYGYHSSDAALITCMISKYHKAHLHFVDGSDGGYAEAARMLKSQPQP
ncbi:MAG: DUF3095 family protein [Bacteroidota bacterium]